MSEKHTTRNLKHDWFTTVLFNDQDRMKSFQMSIPGVPKEDGTTLGWLLRYANPSRSQQMSAAGLIESYEYLLSGAITQKEAFERLRCLRKACKEQFEKGGGG